MAAGAGTYYRGALYGLPRDGSGSVAGLGRRVAAFLADAALLAALLWPDVPVLAGWVTLLLAVVMLVVLPVWRGATPGQALLRLRVVPLIEGEALTEQRGLTVLTALGRASLWLCVPVTFVIDVLTLDDEGRTLYDRISKTIVLNA